MADEPNKIRVSVKEIKDLVESGYPISCATCVHFHESRSKGAPDCGKPQCGGPPLGRDFPDYKGQIPVEKFGSICLMCGDSLLAWLVIVSGKDKKFGLCAKHSKIFDDIRAKSPDVLQIPPIILPLI